MSDVIAYIETESSTDRTICYDCAIPDAENPIHDGPHYGDDVPYPECERCGQVARPENLSNFDVEPPEWLQDEQ
jgi:hypothetical protein